MQVATSVTWSVDSVFSISVFYFWYVKSILLFSLIRSSVGWQGTLALHQAVFLSSSTTSTPAATTTHYYNYYYYYYFYYYYYYYYYYNYNYYY